MPPARHWLFFASTGEYEDFSSEWYQNVGVAIYLTMLLQVVTPHSSVLAKVLVVRPAQRLWVTRAALYTSVCERRARRKVHPDGPAAAQGELAFQWVSVATQPELDRIFQGPEFKIEYRYASSVATLLVCTAYCPGLPLLVPIAAAYFILSYWIDKWLLCRVYRRPPNYDATLAKWFVAWLPTITSFHLAMATYMLGEEDLFPASPIIATDQYQGERMAHARESRVPNPHRTLDFTKTLPTLALSVSGHCVPRLSAR